MPVQSFRDSLSGHGPCVVAVVLILTQYSYNYSNLMCKFGEKENI